MNTEPGQALAKYSESLSLTVYRDPVGIPTIGWGSIWSFDGSRVTMEHRAISRKEADALFATEWDSCANRVLRMIAVPLHDYHLSALTDFEYNTGKLATSTLMRLLNAADYDGASAQFPRWKYASGIVLNGLVTRRKAEKVLFDKGTALLL